MIPTFIVVKAVIMSLCKDPATTVNDHFDQLQEYTSHLEHYKSKLTRDKDLKELVFHTHTAIEKEFHTNASKQPNHKVLKTIMRWVQNDGPGAPSLPTGPYYDPKLARVIACNKGKDCAIHHSCVTVDTESDDDKDDPDKIASSQSLLDYLRSNLLKMVIDEEASRAGWFLKFFKARPSNVVTENKHKESYKVRVFKEPSFCVHSGANSHSFADCSNKSQVGEQHPVSALGLINAFANNKEAAPSVDALYKSYKGLTMSCFTVERPEHLAKLESALMDDVLVLQHTLYAAEKQHTFLLDELECVQSALHPLVPASADSEDPTPVETETPSAPFTLSNVKPLSA
ncbi:uncharacterized protein BT62DRAFT_922064 [Guyanagaster necrorhizus]|uniref:Uncharacterized protein n=1 Tax=Guyanagaster necrorhizus TaxID=856835 RepID=A0A9P8APR9_9AGAR|nr:uncharacterized protein BT62DRAFT_922064 [Guyanagaster necrorhizus MCA 3950]KAG7443284.1 hypothetical protein BT62DRAFT_922064 [Guyanagaster necrorhizus MCA 3950]